MDGTNKTRPKTMERSGGVKLNLANYVCVGLEILRRKMASESERNVVCTQARRQKRRRNRPEKQEDNRPKQPKTVERWRETCCSYSHEIRLSYVGSAGQTRYLYSGGHV